MRLVRKETHGRGVSGCVPSTPSTDLAFCSWEPWHWRGLKVSAHFLLLFYWECTFPTRNEYRVKDFWDEIFPPISTLFLQSLSIRCNLPRRIEERDLTICVSYLIHRTFEIPPDFCQPIEPSADLLLPENFFRYRLARLRVFESRWLADDYGNVKSALPIWYSIRSAHCRV